MTGTIKLLAFVGLTALMGGGLVGGGGGSITTSASAQAVTSTASSLFVDMNVRPTSSNGDSTQLSWVTASRLTHGQIDALGLGEGTHCPANPYDRIVSLHDGPGPEAVTMSRVMNDHSGEIARSLGVPLIHQNTFGRLSKRGDTLVIDAFAAEFIVNITRGVGYRPDPKIIAGGGGGGSNSAVPINSTTPYPRSALHHLSRVEVTCRSPIYRLSCEARYRFMRPNSRLLDPTLVLIHPMEGRTTSPLNGMSAVIASALTSNGAVILGTDVYNDLTNIEYLHFPIPTTRYPCQVTEHWLRTIPVYVESAVLAGLISAVGGDTTSRVDLVPAVVAGHHIQVKTATATSATTSSSSSTLNATELARLLNTSSVIRRFNIINDERPTKLDGLKAAVWLLLALCVPTVVTLAVLIISRKRYISVFRDVWTAPNGQRVVFGNIAVEDDGAMMGMYGGRNGGFGGGDGDSDEEYEEDEEDDEGYIDDEEGEEE